MALDFTALQTEVFARGFDYLNDGGAGLTRAKRFINEAMHEVNAMDRWEYLYANANGASPLTIADLRLVENVYLTNIDTPLPGQDRRLLESVFGNLTVASSAQPQYWYRSTPTTVATYPRNVTFALTVFYWKFAPDLSAGTDAPLMPDRYRQVIVEKAVAKAYRDSDDRGAEADALAEVDRLVALMRLELVPDYLAAPVQAPAPAAVK
jgi:hypothetical protein